MAKRVARNRQDAPKMTAHHFEYLAHVIRNLPWHLPDGAVATVREDGGYTLSVTDAELALAIGRTLRVTNPRFDLDTFVDAVVNG